MIVPTMFIAFWWLVVTLKSETIEISWKNISLPRVNIQQKPYGASLKDFNILGLEVINKDFFGWEVSLVFLGCTLGPFDCIAYFEWQLAIRKLHILPKLLKANIISCPT